MNSKKDADPSIVAAIRALNPELFKKRAEPTPAPTTTNFDFMSEQERYAASSKGGHAAQDWRHADEIASVDTSRYLSMLGSRWEQELRTGAITSSTELEIREIACRCFRNGKLNGIAIKMLNKYASPLSLLQDGERIHVTLLAGSQPQFFVIAD